MIDRLGQKSNRAPQVQCARMLGPCVDPDDFRHSALQNHAPTGFTTNGRFSVTLARNFTHASVALQSLLLEWKPRTKELASKYKPSAKTSLNEPHPKHLIQKQPHSAVIIARRQEIRRAKRSGHPISHGNPIPRRPQHLRIILPIPKCNNII